MRNRWFGILILICCLALLAAGILAACTEMPTPPPTPTPTPTLTATATPTVTLTSTPVSTPTPTPAGALPPTVPAFVENQFIVVGPKNQIATVVHEAAATVAPEKTLIPIKTLDSSSLVAPAPGPGTPTPTPGCPDLNDWAINLYSASELGNDVVKEMVPTINAIGQATVVAEPNYLTGRPPIPVSGDPWTGMGSPYSGSTEAANHEFWTQWAFGRESGIELTYPITGSTGFTRSTTYTGQGVWVGVFDTSPFVTSTVTVIDWITPNLTLTVRHYYTDAIGYLLTPTIAVDVSDHGLFVASLVHAIAPSSTIYLGQVLNKYGQGDLFTLDQALFEFIKGRLGDTKSAGTVINLSLGVHPPSRQEYTWLPQEVASLKELLSIARCYDMAIVAASGNDSYSQTMQIPAVYTDVIGVAASGVARERACFSNKGDVAAPGGDGVADCGLSTGSCLSVLGVVLQSSDNEYGYAYWAGTSFSAPQVSGLAALLLEKGMASKEVYIEITRLKAQESSSDPALGAGIINIPASLE